MKTFSVLFISFCLFTNGANAQILLITKRIWDDYNNIHDHLYNELIPFWDKKAVDMQYGGFMTNFDANGKPVEMPEKCLSTQCRMIWWFSQLNIMVGGIVAHQSAIKIRGVAEHSTVQALKNQSERDAFGELLC